MRAIVVVALLTLLAACGDGDGDGRTRDEAGPSSTTPRLDADRARPPLTFRPVMQLLSRSECNAATDDDRVPSHDKADCFLLGSPELVVTRYEAKAGAPGGPSIDGGLVEVNLGPEDLKQFNALARLCFDRSMSCPTGQLAVVFAGLVRVAPTVQEPEFSGPIAISGTAQEMEELLREMDR